MSDKSNTTNPVPAPTPADLSRDLEAYLAAIEPHRPVDVLVRTLASVACASIRRAMHAEAECERLRAALDDLWHFYDDPGAGSLPKTVARRVCEALGRPVPEHYQGDEWDG